jgi:hypothetical protein
MSKPLSKPLLERALNEAKSNSDGSGSTVGPALPHAKVEVLSGAGSIYTKRNPFVAQPFLSYPRPYQEGQPIAIDISSGEAVPVYPRSQSTAAPAPKSERVPALV